MIKFDGVTKCFKELRALDNVSFEVKEGEVFGFIGENGAGKTTSIRLMTGLLKPTSGSVKIADKNPYKNIEVHKIFSCVQDTYGLYESLTVRENFLFYSSLYEVSGKTAKERYLPLLERFNLADKENINVSKLSKGMRQKASIIRALITNPKILILDEPTAGLDPLSQDSIKSLLKEKAREGTTVFLSSHNLNEIEGICNRIAILRKGELLDIGTVRDIVNKYGNIVFEIDIDKEYVDVAYNLICSWIPKESVEKLERGILIKRDIPISEINKKLVKKDIPILGFKRRISSLEMIYKKIMEENNE
ncbi:ABC transporter ATP-binding protein [bacterium]|nr:ABC transporter ATP-binding protein [bacterium]